LLFALEPAPLVALALVAAFVLLTFVPLLGRFASSPV